MLLGIFLHSSDFGGGISRLWGSGYVTTLVITESPETGFPTVEGTSGPHAGQAARCKEGAHIRGGEFGGLVLHYGPLFTGKPVFSGNSAEDPVFTTARADSEEEREGSQAHSG